MNVKEFRNNLHMDISLAAGAETSNSSEEFLKYVTNQLIEGEEFDDFVECHYEGTSRKKAKMRIDGYSIDEEDGICCLFISDYRGPDEDDSIKLEDIMSLFNKMKFFVEEAIKHKIYEELEESTAIYEFAQILFSEHKNFQKYRFFLLTDAYNMQRKKNIKDIDIYGTSAELNVWDISRIFDLYSSKIGKESIEIFTKVFDCKGIPCVKAVEYKNVKADIEVLPNLVDDFEGSNNDKPENIISYSSYLAVVPGKLLNDLYLEYGSRLLEGNVRSFLSVRGKVNKSIQNTIKHYPGMFFAYNNGIAATASDIDIEYSKEGLRITRIKDLQIVNGGQTTASIANTILTSKKDEKIDISKIFVPMKISVLEHSDSEKIIPKISEYSNSQNKVDESDFFSNHPFHIRIEDISRKLPAPAVGGNQYQQFWYYERARGQYNQGKMKLTKQSELKKYELRYPEKQVIKLVDLAKYMEIYNCAPDVVSKGKQAIVREFASVIKKQWAKSNTEYNNMYFKKLVALAIMFKETDEIIKETDWYKEKHSYKANVIAYTLSVLINFVHKNNKEIDFMRIWDKQCLFPEIKEQIASLCTEVYEFITSSDRGTENVTQWCKQARCWEKAKEKDDWSFYQDFYDTLLDPSELKIVEKVAKFERKVQNESDDINVVLKLGNEYWGKVLEFGLETGYLTDLEIDTLEKIKLMNFKRMCPNPKQASIAMKARQKLIENGMPMEFSSN